MNPYVHRVAEAIHDDRRGMSMRRKRSDNRVASYNKANDTRRRQEEGLARVIAAP